MRCAGPLVGALLLAGCAPREIGSGAFRNAGLIETGLTRGSSTRADVTKLLGVPNGGGRSLFRNVAGGPRDVWYYEDIAATDMSRHAGVWRMELRNQMLLVFFRGDRFDGYLWTSNSAPATAE